MGNDRLIREGDKGTDNVDQSISLAEDLDREAGRDRGLRLRTTYARMRVVCPFDPRLGSNACRVAISKEPSP